MSDKGKIPSRQCWFIREGRTAPEYQLDSLIEKYIEYMACRTLMMFDYKGLPDGITNKDIEKIVQFKGKGFFLKLGDRFYLLEGSFSNYVTWNYEPKEAIIRNPALDDLKNSYIIDDDVIVIPNDSFYVGLMDMFEDNALQLASTDISINFALYNMRLKSIFKADDDNTADSINDVLDDVYNGKRPSTIVSEDLYKKSIESIEYNRTANNDIKELIELKQYLKANWYIDLGVNANYNMKREAVSEGEFEMNDDALMPLIDNMLMVRKDAIKKINSKWNLDISVDFSSAWKKIRKEIILSTKEEEAEVKVLENSIKEGDESVEGNETEGNIKSNE